MQNFLKLLFGEKKVSNQAIIFWNFITHNCVRILVWLLIEIRYQWLKKDRRLIFLSCRSLR